MPIPSDCPCRTDFHGRVTPQRSTQPSSYHYCGHHCYLLGFEAERRCRSQPSLLPWGLGEKKVRGGGQSLSCSARLNPTRSLEKAEKDLIIIQSAPRENMVGNTELASCYGMQMVLVKSLLLTPQLKKGSAAAFEAQRNALSRDTNARFLRLQDIWILSLNGRY